MKKFSRTMAVVGVSLLCGCAVPNGEIPVATRFPPTGQYKLQSAAHWQSIAASMAKRLSAELKEARPLYLQSSSSGSPFDRAFANHLLAALLDEGFSLQKSPAAALLLEVSSQTIHFNAEHAAAPAGPLPSSTEIVITVAVNDATRHLFKHSEVYYVADGDAWLYQPAVTRKELPMRQFTVVGQ